MKFILISVLSMIIKAEIVSQSSISKCYSNSSNSTTCSDKLLISLTVQNSQSISTEYIKINQSTEGNTTISFKSPLVIAVTKTPVYTYYPINYKKDYNSNPKEVKISAAYLSCDDSYNSDSPTCGFQYYKNGSKIFDSQGFCCECGLLDLIGLSDEYARGNVCKASSLNEASMAFCLRFSSLWYSAYTIGSYAFYYNISVQIYFEDETNETLSLGSQKQSAESDGIIARIVGDFIPLQTPPSLESYLLMVPTSPISNARVQQAAQNYMLIQQNLVGDGECNKIGVGYSAFRTENDRCSKQVSSCLQNQIEDFYQSDQKLISNGKSPEYMISKWGTFSQVSEANQTYLKYSVQGSMSTLITLEISTDGKISFVTNVGKGKIDFVEVQNFMALTGNGTIYAQITNTGDLDSEYNTFLNCSENVLPLNSKVIFLKSFQSQIINASITVASENNSTNYCNFTLLNNLGTILDYKELEFNTTQLDHKNDQAPDEQQYTDKEEDAESVIANPCNSQCSFLIDITCYFYNSCDKQIYTFFSVFISLFILTAICCVCCSYRKKCCCWSNSSASSSNHNQSIEIYVPPKKRTKLQESMYFKNTSYVSLKYENMFLNLKKGIDPIPNQVGDDISVDIVVAINKRIITKINVKKDSRFVDIFKEVYGEEDHEEGISQYLQTKLEQYQQYKTIITQQPLYILI